MPGKVDVHASDADGWTALHNASSKVSFVTNYRFGFFLNQTSKGYLDIVQWLCEEGGAASATDTGRGIDTPNKVGWTPLSNSVSYGSYLSVSNLETYGFQ